MSLPGIILAGLLTFVMAPGAFVVPQLLGGVGNLVFGQIIVLIATVSLDWSHSTFVFAVASSEISLERGGKPEQPK